MSQERVLAAIMFTDIVGYTALMGEDSDKALELVRISKEIQKPLVEKHNGKWLKEMGDGAMAQFSTALDAVQCATDIQQLSKANFDGDLRIGIHLGDITIQNNDIYGEGVNIASRLESICDPGGIYVSESIEKAIKGQKGVSLLFLGGIKLKNVSYSVGVYALQGNGLPPPSIVDRNIETDSLWNKAKRRGILRILLVYIAISFIIYKFSPLLLDVSDFYIFGSNPLLIVVLTTMPFALMLAWKYERSPEGFVKTSSLQSYQNPYSSSQRKPLTSNSFLLVLSFIAVAGSFINSYFETKSSKNQEISVAVIPLRNLSDNSNQEYIAAMTAELIRDKLSKLEDIRVISMTSTRQYKESEKTTAEIGKELNVTHILEGSIFEFENSLRIVIQLIEITSDDHVWSETYDGDSKDILKVQNDIAYSVAAELEKKWGIGVDNLLDATNDLDPVTFDLYLRGKALLDKVYNTGDSLSCVQAISTFSSVISEYPEFADAYALLADAYQAQNYLHGEYNTPDTSLYLLNKALQIDQTSIIANEFFGNYYFYGDGNDPDKGIEYFNTVLRVNPNAHYIKSVLGTYYLRKKDFKKALSFLVEGIKGDPLNAELDGNEFYERILYYNNIYVLLMEMGMLDDALLVDNKLNNLRTIPRYYSTGFVHQLLGEFDTSLYYFEKQYSLDTMDMFSRNQLAGANLYLGKWEEANQLYEISLEKIKDDTLYFDNFPSFLHRYGYGLWQLGDTAKAKIYFDQHTKIIQKFVDDGSDWPGHLYDLAIVHAFLGRDKEALQLLREIPYWYVTYGLAQMDPLLDPIRDTPEFQQILRTQHDEMLELRRLANVGDFTNDIEWIMSR